MGDREQDPHHHHHHHPDPRGERRSGGLGGGGANPRAWTGALAGCWARLGHFRSQGVIVGISLSTMSTMPAPDPVSAGAWRRWLKDYTGKGGRRPLFEPGGRKTDATLWSHDLNCNKVDYYLTNGSAFFLFFFSARSYDNERSVSQPRHCTVKNEPTQAAASGVEPTAPLFPRNRKTVETLRM